MERGTFSTDACLWVPKGRGPWPVIVGLGFLGPIGVLQNADFPVDPYARVYARPEWGARDGRLLDQFRGQEAYRWPVEMLTKAGFAVMISCYGSWAPDDPDAIEAFGLKPFLRVETGAISLWAWAIMRLVDAVTQLNDLAAKSVIVAGHSRLGKAALWAAANDARIGTVFANNAGCFGTAPSAHELGETWQDLRARFPHWVRPQADAKGLDQHHLMAACAPRRLYVSSAENDVWADPVGTYLALVEASKAWSLQIYWPDPREMWRKGGDIHFAALGHHLRPGEHDMLPEDWARFLTFLQNAEGSMRPDAHRAGF